MIENIKTAIQSYFCRRKEVREDFLQCRRVNAAERDIQVMEYKSALWIACKGIPLVAVSAIGNEEALYKALRQARANYIDCELKAVIK